MDEQIKAELDILKKDWENRTAEIMFHSQRYHSQTNLVYLYLSAVVSMAAISYSDQAQKLFQNLSQTEFKIIVMIVLILGVIIQFYLGSLMLDSLYMMYANGGRIAFIEKEINGRLGKQILKWESEIIPKMYDIKYWQYKSWIKPNYIVSAWALLIWVITAGGLIVIWKRVVDDYFLIFLIVMGAGTLFHAFQWIVLQTAGLEFIQKVVNGEPLKTKAPTYISISIKIIALILTLTLGIVPFLILSIQTDSFWINSKYNFPLIVLPSVWVGDTLVLPMFNYFVADTIEKNKKMLQAKKVYIILLISTLLSIIINSYTHYSWIQDKYTGFMDTTYGSLSLAGWWHYGFSVLQMVIVFSFAGIWFTQSKQLSIDNLVKFENTWKIFVVFTSISVLDFLTKHYLVFKTPITIFNITNELSSFITLFLSGITLMIMVFLRHKRHASKKATA